MASAGSADRGNTASDGTESRPTGPVLALYPNLRQTGWAVFGALRREGTPVSFLAASGTVGPGLRAKMEPRQRIACQLQSLSAIAERWRPQCVVCSWPGGMDWGAAGMRQLQEQLRLWAESQSLPAVDYPAPHVRAALAGKPNASKGTLAYSVMERLNLVGESRSALEWEAIAAGYHHLRANSKQVRTYSVKSSPLP